MFENVTIIVAFMAGVVSFISPCVLPIIPGFLAYLAGTKDADTNNKKERLRIFLASVFFVLGFAVIFAAAGVLLNTVLSAVAYDAQVWFARIGGIIIIFFGLYLMRIFRIPFLEKTRAVSVKKRFASRYVTSFVFGAAFAVGWTPCVGAALGAILGLAATAPGQALWLLLSYSLGLGLPFLVIGAFTGQATRFFTKHQKAFSWLSIIFGIILVVVGILVFTQTLSRLAQFDVLFQFLK